MYLFPRAWYVHTSQILRHPNLCVANLLGEVCPICQKFRDVSPFLGGRLKPLRLHESWREGRDALKMNAAGAVHCLWRSLCARLCKFWQLGRPGARCACAPGSPKEETKRSDWIRLNQPDSAWREKTGLSGFERIWADRKSGFLQGFAFLGARESTKNKRNGFVGKAHYKFGFALRMPLPSRYFEVGRLTNSGGLGIGGIKAHEVKWLPLGMGVHSRASWDGGCPASYKKTKHRKQQQTDWILHTGLLHAGLGGLYKLCRESNWCNTMQYITSWKLPGIHLMQQFWPCRSRVVKIWCTPLQHWNRTEFTWCNAMQYSASLKSNVTFQTL